MVPRIFTSFGNFQAEDSASEQHPRTSASPVADDGITQQDAVGLSERKNFATALPSHPGTFAFPKPMLRENLSAVGLQPPQDRQARGQRACHSHTDQNASGAGDRAQTSHSTCFRLRTPSPSMDLIVHERFAVRRAAGEEYANAVLATSAAPCSHIIGQHGRSPANTELLPRNSQALILSPLRAQVPAKICSAKRCRPDHSQSRCEPAWPSGSSWSPSTMHVTNTVPLQGGGDCEPFVVAERHRNWSHDATASMLLMSKAECCPSGVCTPLSCPEVFSTKQQRMHEDCGHMPSLSDTWAVTQPPHRGVRQTLDNHNRHSPTMSAQAAAAVQGGCQRPRSVAEQLIDPSEIEESIRRLQRDRSLEAAPPLGDVDDRSKIDLHGTLQNYHQARSMEEERNGEVSLRGGINPVAIDQSRQGLARAGSPPFQTAASRSGTAVSLVTAEPEPICGVQAECAEAQASACHVWDAAVSVNAACYEHNRAAVMGHCDNRPTEPEGQSRPRMSVTEAYSRLGIVCPGSDAHTLEPWDVGTWKAAWRESGNRILGQAGVWTLEAISCIVCDRRESFHERQQPMIHRLQELQRDLQEELRTAASASMMLRGRKKAQALNKTSQRRQWVGACLSPATLNTSQAATSKHGAKHKRCGKALEAVEESDFKRELLLELIRKIKVGLCFNALRHAAQEAKLIQSILQHIGGSQNIVLMQSTLMAWRDMMFQKALRAAQAQELLEEKQTKHMDTVFSSWRVHTHEESWRRRHVGHGLAAVAANMLRSCMRHWQLAVAKHNCNFQAEHTATIFLHTRLKMVAFHVWCQSTAARCKMRANHQTVLSALRLASENLPSRQLIQGNQKPSIPVFVAQFKAPCESTDGILRRLKHCPVMDGQQHNLSVAKDLMARCVFGLRFSATADDVAWAANIRRFVPKAFQDSLWNGIRDRGARKPRRWVQHGGLQASFTKHPPTLTDDESEWDGDEHPMWHHYAAPAIDDRRVWHGIQETRVGPCVSTKQPTVEVRRPAGPACDQPGLHLRHDIDDKEGTVARLEDLGGAECPAQEGRRNSVGYQGLTISAAAKARPRVSHPARFYGPPHRAQSKLAQTAPVIDCGVDMCSEDTAKQTADGDRCCMDQALDSGAFAGLLKSFAEEAAKDVECKQGLGSHEVVHSSASAHVADQLMHAKKLQSESTQISDKITAFQEDAQNEEEEDSKRLDEAMDHAARASVASEVASAEHTQALGAVDASRTRLLHLQELKVQEAARRAAAADELTAKQSELSVLHARLAAASQQQQSHLASGASQAAARLSEAKQAEQALHADLMQAAWKERDARELQLDLQTQANNLLDKYIMLCAMRTQHGLNHVQQETSEGLSVKKQLQYHRVKADEAASLVEDLCTFRSDLQVKYNAAVSDVQALEEEIRKQDKHMSKAASQHDDVTLKCAALHQELFKLEQQTAVMSDLEGQHRAALQNVLEAEDRESLALKALLQTKELSEDAARAATAVQHTVGSRRNARLMSLDVLNTKRQRLDTQLQQLQQAIIEAPAHIVNQAVLIFHQRNDEEGRAQANCRQQAAALVADKAVAPSRRDRPPEQQCLAPRLIPAAASDGSSGSSEQPFDVQQHNLPSPASGDSVDVGSQLGLEAGTALSWKLVQLSHVPRNRHESAMQFAMRKVVMQSIAGWWRVCMTARQLEDMAEQLDRASCTRRMLRYWHGHTLEILAWRRQQLCVADMRLTAVTLARALYGWRLFVVQQQESLHRFLTLRRAHARHMQQTVLSVLWAHATDKRHARQAILAAQLQAMQRWLWGWRRVVIDAQDMRAKALLVFATCAERRLRGIMRAWHAITCMKRDRRRLQRRLLMLHRKRRLHAALLVWFERYQQKCLLRRVFGGAEQAWEQARVEEIGRRAEVFAAAFQAWASHCKVMRDRRMQTTQNAMAAAFHRQACTSRALHMWAVNVGTARQEEHARALRDITFRVWRGRARDKRACSSTVSARFKLKALGLTNEFQYGALVICKRCMTKWLAQRRRACAHRQQALLRKSMAGFCQGVLHTRQLIERHHEYWRHGVPLLKAWRAWTSVTQMKRYLRVERDWVRQAARQLGLSKAMRAWIGYVREGQRQQALAVAADCHRADVLLERVWNGWKRLEQSSKAAGCTTQAAGSSNLSLCREKASSTTAYFASIHNQKTSKVPVHRKANVVVGRLKTSSMRTSTKFCRPGSRQKCSQRKTNKLAVEVSRASSSDCDSLALWLDSA
eukprot:jgi/Ulvmu1/2932/UM149_0011.1